MEAMENSQLVLKEGKLAKALGRLEEVLDDPVDAHKAIIDATIQRFEFTFELFWKWLKLLLENAGVEANFPKQVFKEAYKAKWIDDEALWLKMLNDRNLTSHTYDEELARVIYESIKTYAPLMRRVFEERKVG